MSKCYFIKQNHKNAKLTFSVFFACIFVIVAMIVCVNNQYHWGYAVFLVIALVLCMYLSKLLDEFGVYIFGQVVYYKTIKKKEIDINKIVGIKIIKSEWQVNLAWPTYLIEDKGGNALYTMVCLSAIRAGMLEYPYGDIEFIRRNKKDIIMYSIYDESFLEYLIEHNNDIKVI